MNKKYEVKFKEDQPAEMGVQIQPKTNDIHVIAILPNTKTVLYLILSDAECDDQFNSSTIHFMGIDIDVIVFMTCNEEAFSKIIRDQLDENTAVLNQPKRDDNGFIVLQYGKAVNIQDVKIHIYKHAWRKNESTIEEYLRAFLAELQLDRDVSISIEHFGDSFDWYAIRKYKSSDFIIYNEIMSLIPKEVDAPEDMIIRISRAFAKLYRTTVTFGGELL